jgi:hypothetical protein
MKSPGRLFVLLVVKLLLVLGLVGAKSVLVDCYDQRVTVNRLPVLLILGGLDSYCGAFLKRVIMRVEFDGT